MARCNADDVMENVCIREFQTQINIHFDVISRCIPITSKRHHHSEIRCTCVIFTLNHKQYYTKTAATNPFQHGLAILHKIDAISHSTPL